MVTQPPHWAACSSAWPLLWRRNFSWYPDLFTWFLTFHLTCTLSWGFSKSGSLGANCGDVAPWGSEYPELERVMHPGVLLALLAARAHCWHTLYRIPTSLYSGLLFSLYIYPIPQRFLPAQWGQGLPVWVVTELATTLTLQLRRYQFDLKHPHTAKIRHFTIFFHPSLLLN